MNNITFRRDDARASLCAVMLDAMLKGDPEHPMRFVRFAGDLAELLWTHGYGTDPVSVVGELRSCGNHFEVIYWLYGAIERSGLTEAEIFTLLGRYGVRPNENGGLHMTADGNAPPVYFAASPEKTGGAQERGERPHN